MNWFTVVLVIVYSGLIIVSGLGLLFSFINLVTGLFGVKIQIVTSLVVHHTFREKEPCTEKEKIENLSTVRNKGLMVNIPDFLIIITCLVLLHIFINLLVNTLQ